MSAKERSAFDTFERLMKAHPDFAYVYAGLEDGGYTQAPSENMGNKYDPRKRPWYIQGKQSPTEVTLLSAYITTKSVPNVGVVAKAHDSSGKLVGIGAVDMSLAKLTEIAANINIGKTGYMMIVQNDGTVLADPRHKDFVFKKMGELAGAYSTLNETKGGLVEDFRERRHRGRRFPKILIATGYMSQAAPTLGGLFAFWFLRGPKGAIAVRKEESP